MKKTWNVNVWGVRGSFPTPDAHFLLYGGNTSCISAECEDSLIVFDAGSGLIQLGNSLSKKGRTRIDILLSHLHVDHVMGLFQFKLLYNQDARIHLYGSSEVKGQLLRQLETLVGAPYWPVGLSNCPAHIEVHEICPEETFFLAGQPNEANDIRIHTLRGNHPGQSLLYRLETKDTSIVYALDCEIDDDMFSSLKEFSRGSDLIIWDANFTKEDSKKHKGWGHSSWEQGIAFCQSANIKKILMTHYSPEYLDDFLKNEENKAKQASIMCYFAKEGMRIQI